MTPDTSTCQVSVANNNKKKAGQSKKNTKANSFSMTGTLTKAVAVVLAPVLAVLLVQIIPRPSELLPAFERVHGQTPGSEDLDNQFYLRTNVWFSSGDSNGTMLNAWQYQPKDWRQTAKGKIPPVVVMGHGLGAQRDFGLHMTADVFARAGLGVLVFDYRTFGGSDGEPRHWASPSRHLQDWRAAIKYANSPEVAGVWDASRMVLWGTSYAGGHVLVMASELGSAVSGVVSQVPHLNAAAAAGASLAVRGLVPSIRLVLAGIYDTICARLGYSPVYVRLAGLHQTTSVMALTETELKTYKAKHPEVKLGGWQNQILARFALEATRYSPYNYLHNITSPTLLVSASKDTLCPPAVIADASRILGVDVLIYPVDHFALYLTQVWADNMAQQLAFACKVTNQECPRDKSYELSEIVTEIGARHREAQDKAAAGTPETGSTADPSVTVTPPSEAEEPREDDGQTVDRDDEGFEEA